VRWIFLSPHLDDAVYSCGGLIYDLSLAGQSVEVWTVCAGDPPPGPLSPQAERMQREWGTGSAAATVALRRAEDRAALARVGAAGWHLDVPDCIYRRTPSGEACYPDRYAGPRAAAEAGLPEQIAATLASRLRPDDALVCPLAVGGHLDHVLVRDSVRALGRRLRYYPDIPYVLNFPGRLSGAAAGMQPQLQPVSDTGLEAWLAGIAAYASQLGVQFQDEARMRARMRAYWERQHGIQLWTAV